jgi:putative DNA primase/helicase
MKTIHEPIEENEKFVFQKNLSVEELEGSIISTAVIKELAVEEETKKPTPEELEELILPPEARLEAEKESQSTEELLTQNYFYLAKDIVDKQIDNIPLITIDSTKDYNKDFGCVPDYYFPYFDKDGNFVFYIVRWNKENTNDGKKKTRPLRFNREKNKWWKSLNSEEKRPLYNLLELKQRPNAKVIVVEGELKCEIAKRLFPGYVIVSSSFGGNAYSKTDWSELKNREVVIAPDNDKTGAKYGEAVIKQLKKNKAAKIELLLPKTLGQYIIQDSKWVKRAGEVPTKYDMADAIADGWTAELIQKAMAQFKPFFTPIVTNECIEDTENIYQGEEILKLGNYTFKLGGETLFLEHITEEKPLYKVGENINDLGLVVKIKQTWIALCGYVKVTHHIRDVESNNWGLLLNMTDIDGRNKDVVIYKKDLATDKSTMELLLGRGLRINKLKKVVGNLLMGELLHDYLNTSIPDKRAIGSEKVGWNGKSYLMPYVDNPRNAYHIADNVPKEEFILQSHSSTSRKLEKRGTLQSWQQEIGGYIEDNHALEFAAAVALTAPLLEPTNQEGFAILLCGNSSIGKSTALCIANSIWGAGKPSSFRITDNAAEVLLKNCNDGLVTLDELGQAKASCLDDIIYMIANGIGKGRARKNGEAQTVSLFKAVVIASGEIGPESKLAEKGKTVTAGQSVRLLVLNVLMKYGIFNTLHGFGSGSELSDHFKKASVNNQGVVIDEFMKHITANFDEVISEVDSNIEVWLSKCCSNITNGQILRVAHKFALTAAVGEVAIKAGIFSFKKGNSLKAAEVMFNKWLDGRGGEHSHELNRILKNLKVLISEGINRFLNIDGSEEGKNIKTAGYKRIVLINDEHGIPREILSEIYMLPTVFDSEVLEGKSRKSFVPELVSLEVLEKNTSNNRFTKSVWISKHGSKEVFVINPSALEELSYE